MRIDELKDGIDAGKVVATHHVTPASYVVEHDIRIFRAENGYIHELRYPKAPKWQRDALTRFQEPQRTPFPTWEALLDRLKSKRGSDAWEIEQREEMHGSNHR